MSPALPRPFSWQLPGSRGSLCVTQPLFGTPPELIVVGRRTVRVELAPEALLVLGALRDSALGGPPCLPALRGARRACVRWLCGCAGAVGCDWLGACSVGP